MSEPILSIQHIVKRFPSQRSFFGREKESVHAIRDVSLDIASGETIGLVGESGCGKSTLGMLCLGLLLPDNGQVVFQGQNIFSLSSAQLRELRQYMQVVFQDPYASLNPRMIVGDIIGEPLLIHGCKDRKNRDAQVLQIMQRVGLKPDDYIKYPHEFSGGQRQRIGIARAIALKPKLIIADEPVSALDVSIRGEILNLFSDLRDEFGLTYIFISHDLNVVEHISHRIAVMYLGRIVEIISANHIEHACHPYTKALLSAIPTPNPHKKTRRVLLKGDVPSPISPPCGCAFHPRCQYATDECQAKMPELSELDDGHCVACHHYQTLM